MKNMVFHRLFAKSMYKNLKLPLGEMTFTKNFVNDNCGDLYPVINKSPECNEIIENNTYSIISGAVERMAGQFFPYASYEIDCLLSGGKCGFVFCIPNGKAAIICSEDRITFSENGRDISFKNKSFCKNIRMVITCRPKAFDVYLFSNGKPEYFHTFSSDIFNASNSQKIFQKGYVCLSANGNVTVNAASFYIDCGISQADIRPIRYENGEVMTENGKVYLTASIRMQEEMFQGVFAWVPSTSNFELTGALFYDSGDGLWCGDVAASVLYHRENKQWLLWVCSFSHGHILGYSAFRGDPRFGVNVIEITRMSKAEENDELTEFLGFEGDEDPDFYYDETEKKWYMAICRMDKTIGNYRYFFFKADKPFEGYKYIGKGYDGAETGGSFLTFNGEGLFICGNDYCKRSDYRIYTKSGMGKAKFDFPDGGFRGWGTVIPVNIGSRKRYFWLTFDRHNGSSYNWSYGNIYCFEATDE